MQGINNKYPSKSDPTTGEWLGSSMCPQSPLERGSMSWVGRYKKRGSRFGCWYAAPYFPFMDSTFWHSKKGIIDKFKE